MRATGTTPQPRERILRASADLLAEGGRQAVSTRSVSAAAMVQAQTIYRHFGDMKGLLDEVARQGYAAYLADKRSNLAAGDPVEQLRRGWDLHVAFGLAHPALYRLIHTDPRPGAPSAVMGEANGILTELVTRVAETGRLRTSIEAAEAMIHAAGVGVAVTLINADDEGRLAEYEGLSENTRDAVLAALVTDAKKSAPVEEDRVMRGAQHAVALKALLEQGEQPFTESERGLLGEWLTRLVTAATPAAD
ncbi:TetR/AcrR family transcriptional regulator [Streptomyces sp. NPDC004726]